VEASPHEEPAGGIVDVDGPGELFAQRRSEHSCLVLIAFPRRSDGDVEAVVAQHPLDDRLQDPARLSVQPIAQAREPLGQRFGYDDPAQTKTRSEGLREGVHADDAVGAEQPSAFGHRRSRKRDVAIGVVGDDGEAEPLGEFDEARGLLIAQREARRILKGGHREQRLRPQSRVQSRRQRVDVDAVGRHADGYDVDVTNEVEDTEEERVHRVVDDDGVARVQGCEDGEGQPVRSAVGHEHPLGRDAFPLRNRGSQRRQARRRRVAQEGWERRARCDLVHSIPIDVDRQQLGRGIPAPEVDGVLREPDQSGVAETLAGGKAGEQGARGGRGIRHECIQTFKGGRV
jgi:hypothetical protein